MPWSPSATSEKLRATGWSRTRWAARRSRSAYSKLVRGMGGITRPPCRSRRPASALTRHLTQHGQEVRSDDLLHGLAVQRLPMLFQVEPIDVGRPRAYLVLFCE